MLFKKKEPRKGEFDTMPIVEGKATNKSRYDMEVVCKIILTQILKVLDVSLLVVTDDRMVKKFDTSDIEIQAILQGYPEIKRYVLYLRSNLTDSLLSIVCHEMVHLKQYVDKRLDLRDKRFYWLGKEYEKSNYGDRPGEIEARKEQYNIEKEVKKMYYE